MIFKKKKIFWKIIRFILEPLPNIEELKNKYSVIYILSYDKYELPGFSVKKKDTPVIYLNKSIDEIMSGFNSTTRNEIRKTFDNKIPDLKFIDDDRDLTNNYRLSEEFEKFQGRKPDSIEAYNDCKVFSAYYKDQLIANIICFDTGRVLRAKVICSKRLETDDKELYRIVSYAGRRLMYNVCKYGLDNGYKMYDLGSVNFDKKNLAKFKMNFTQDLIAEYTYTYRAPWLKIIEKLRSLIKKIK
jgi:hypothetical protein